MGPDEVSQHNAIPLILTPIYFLERLLYLVVARPIVCYRPVRSCPIGTSERVWHETEIGVSVASSVRRVRS
jgi:hypothetical protein